MENGSNLLNRWNIFSANYQRGKNQINGVFSVNCNGHNSRQEKFFNDHLEHYNSSPNFQANTVVSWELIPRTTPFAFIQVPTPFASIQVPTPFIPLSHRL